MTGDKTVTDFLQLAVVTMHSEFGLLWEDTKKCETKAKRYEV